MRRRCGPRSRGCRAAGLLVTCAIVPRRTELSNAAGVPPHLASALPRSASRSRTSSRNLSGAGLIDRYHLLGFPILLGAGKGMFSDTDKDKQWLELVESETHADGIQKLVYDVVN